MRRIGLADLVADDPAPAVVSAPILTLVGLDGVDWSDSELAAAARERVGGVVHGLVVGISENRLPAEARRVLETLDLTLAPGGPGATWVDAEPQPLVDAVLASPRAAVVLGEVLRLTSRVGVAEGLVVESLAYSMLLAGPDFARWRASVPARTPPAVTDAVLVDRSEDVLRVTLNRPERHNAFGRQVRHGVLEALEIAVRDDTVSRVELVGVGPSFSSGGDLDEFGTAEDVVSAHEVRLSYSAGLAVHRLRDRVRPVLHGSCLGAGIEVPAFASVLAARPDVRIGLPEVSMGLIPGAGGTVSVAARIGRWRTAWLGLTGALIGLDTALAWGLVDERA
jgi:hypothetical protein